MKFTCSQLNLIYESANLLKEDFDKVVKLVQNVIKQIDDFTSRHPTDKEQLLFHIINHLDKNRNTMIGISSGEAKLFFQLLGNYYNIRPEKLRSQLNLKADEAFGYEEKKYQQAKEYSPTDWLMSYAKHQGMDVKQPSKSSRSDVDNTYRSGTIDRKVQDNRARMGYDYLDEEFPGLLTDYIDLSVRGSFVLDRAGIRTLSDLLKKKPSDLIKLRNVGRVTMKEYRQRILDLATKLASKDTFAHSHREQMAVELLDKWASDVRDLFLNF